MYGPTQLLVTKTDKVGIGRILRHLTHRARALRRRATSAERKLWDLLRGRKLGVKFRRQHPLEPFVVDFCCIEAGLVIEVDGGYHCYQRQADRRRDAWLRAAGWIVLRFTNEEVLDNPTAVLQQIRASLPSIYQDDGANGRDTS